MMPVNFEELERILADVRKPGRYVGGEYNSIVKDWHAVSMRVCLAFPDVYELGMSNLGLAILYDILNALPDVLAERTYMPWVDMAGEMRAGGIPLYTLENRRPLDEFHIVGFSLPSEQLYTNVLEMLDLSGLPLRSEERNASHPLVIAGGHAVFNPEPMADFVDAFVIGDGEEAIIDLLCAFQDVQEVSRDVQLQTLSRIPGVYVPRFYDVCYKDDDTVAVIRSNSSGAPTPVFKRVVSPLPPLPVQLLVPNIDISHNRAAIEIQRGCTRGCRFCHAGMVMRPVRERPVEEVLAALEAILPSTGFEEVGLLSLSSSDYSHIDRLVEAIIERFSGERLSISLPSLRADSFSVALAEAVAQGRHSGFTFAPEAATEQLRRVINKPIATAQVLEVAEEVFELGWRTIKLYFLIGLPGEQMQDVQAIADLAREVWHIGRKAHGRKAQVNVSVNTFVPKPHTPFQWVGIESEGSIGEKQSLLRHALRGRGLKLDYSDSERTLLEAVLSRGDRRLGKVIQRAWELGARFDAWDEQWNGSAWKQAFEESEIEPGFYACRERSLQEIFPWDVINIGVSKAFLLKDYQRSQRAETLVDCREQCHACGVLLAYRNRWSETWRCPPVQADRVD
jgi:radical SAM family uncharacterized protein